jgi:hypothetical protein
MIMCCFLGLPNLVRCAMDARISPETRDVRAKNATVLALAAQEGHVRVVKVLLENGADPHASLTTRAARPCMGRSSSDTQTV